MKLTGNNLVFMQDNDPKHTSKLCENYELSQGPDYDLIELL
jgi:hypothetical protein